MKTRSEPRTRLLDRVELDRPTRRGGRSGEANIALARSGDPKTPIDADRFKGDAGAMGFYDEIAGQYEEVVGSPGRQRNAERLAEWLTSEWGARRVLDVACGTGLHARELARRGCEVTAADASAEMIAQAQAASLNTDATVHWLTCPMERIAEKVDGPFDVVLCLGNSLPHLLTDTQLRRTFEGFLRLLMNDGIALVQLLNYHRLLTRGERIVGVTRSGSREYIRFYDLGPNRVRFNVLELNWSGDRCSHALHRTDLRPWGVDELRQKLTRAGFAGLHVFAGVDRSPFDPEESQGVLLMAQRDERTATL